MDTPKRPFYGNQHITPDQRIERMIAASRKAVTGPTNRELRERNKKEGDAHGMREEQEEEGQESEEVDESADD